MAKTPNDELLEAIRSRGEKSTEFWHGIRLASDHVHNLEEHIGMDRCYRWMARGNKSYNDILKEAKRTLVYANGEMELEEAVTNASQFKSLLEGAPKDVSIPKNALMVFRHTLTSSRKDRDGDVMHSDGATVDPKMLLLWQHVHTMPIGSYLFTASQNPNRLKVVSCIVDVNDLCHDSAVMIDNGMGRFSHGFRAQEFRKNKEGVDDNGEGFDVKRFEIMEESLVSVPANTDAEVEEVLLSLVEGHKLTSAVMKEVGQGIRSKRSIQVPGVTFREKVAAEGVVERELVCSSFDQLKAASDAGIIGGKKDENEPGDREGAGAGGREEPSRPSEETNVKAAGKGDEETSDEEGVTDEVECDECQEMVTPDKDGKCPQCGADLEGEEEEKSLSVSFSRRVDTSASFFEELERVKESIRKEFSPDGEKVGRVLSTSNLSKIQKAKEHVDDVSTEEYLKRPHSAQLKAASSHLGEVLQTAVTAPGVQGEGDTGNQLAVYSTQTAMAHVLAHATPEERKTLIIAIKAIEESDAANHVVNEYRDLTKAKAKPEADPEEPDEDDKEDDGKEKPRGPEMFKGDLHKEHHKGRQMVPGKEVREYLTSKCGMSCKGVGKDSCDVEHTGKEVASHLIDKGWSHTHKSFVDEPEDKTCGRKRVDAFMVKGIKATAIHTVGQKACKIFMSRKAAETKKTRLRIDASPAVYVGTITIALGDSHAKDKE